jgi:hypothetical protein
VAGLEIVGAHKVRKMLFSAKDNPTYDFKYAFSSSAALTTSSDELSKARRLQMQNAMAAQGLYDTTPTAATH